MPRLIAILLVLLAGMGLAALLARESRDQGDKRSRKTYRPRASRTGSSRAGTTGRGDTREDTDDIFMMSRSDAAGLRDPLTGATIDTDGQVWRCSRCQSLYNESSVAALAQDNQGACVQCQGTHRNPVSFTGQ